jgi:hypothetical protein
MIAFIGTSLQLQSIMTARNHWRSMTRSIPCWTTSIFSSTVANHESRLTHWSPAEWRFSDETLECTNELHFINVRDPNREFDYCSSWMRCLKNVREPFVSGSPILAFRLRLPSRCLANGHIQSQCSVLQNVRLPQRELCKLWFSGM